MYLVVVKDTHTDDEYHLFVNEQKALEKARALVDLNKEYYKDTKVQVYPPRGDVLFNEQSLCGTWQVRVHETSHEISEILSDLTDVGVWHEDYYSRSYCVLCGKIDNDCQNHYDHCVLKRAQNALRNL